MKHCFSRHALAVLFMSVISAQSISAAPYDVVDLGTLGGDSNFAYAINNLNEVVGTAEGVIITDDQTPSYVCLDGSTITFREFCTHGYLFQNNMLIDIGGLDASVSVAIGINDQTSIVGYATEVISDNDDTTDDPISERGFISYAGAQIVALPYPPETLALPDTTTPAQRAIDISNNDLIVGFAVVLVSNDLQEEDVKTRPYVYDLNTNTYTILPLFSDELDRTGAARAINDNGQVVGWANSEDEDANNAFHAFLWDPASPATSKDIGTLGGYTSQAWDINDNGYIVGAADTDTGYYTNENLAFIYNSTSETMTQIPEFSTLSDYRSSIAYSINNSEAVVGSAQAAANASVSAAFLYQMGAAELINLNNMIPCDSGWNLVTARSINDQGYITGTGTFNGDVRSYLLQPTGDTVAPNCGDDGDDDTNSSSSSMDSSWLWLLAGLSVLTLLRRRKAP